MDQTSENLNVLMITGRADFGGGPEHVFQLSKALLGRVNILIACPKAEPYWQRYATLIGEDRMLEIPHREFSIKALRQMISFAKKRKCTLVHGHGRSAGIYARPAAHFLGLPCFVTTHGATPITDLKSVFYASVEFLLSFITDCTIAVSSTEERTLRKLCVGKNRLLIIPNGVEIPPYHGVPAGKLTPPVTVIHATRYLYQKNPQLLVSILEILKKNNHLDKFRFVILGEGDGRDAFLKDIRKAQVDHVVEVVGAVTNPGHYLDKAYCLISTSRWEGLPLFLLEAMARGIPTIATDVVGNADAVVHEQTGFLFNQNQPHEAVEYLVQLASDADNYQKLCNQSRSRAEAMFSVEAMAVSTLDQYQVSLS